MESWLRFPVQESTVPLVRGALEIRRRHRLSYWDAAIVEAARLLGCDTLLSEDLAHGRTYEGVKVVNPFRLTRTAPASSRPLRRGLDRPRRPSDNPAQGHTPCQ